MSKRVKMFGPTINFSHQRIDVQISFSASHDMLVDGDGSEQHLKKCLLAALLKEAKEEGGFDEVLTATGWNFIAEPGIVADRRCIQHGPDSLPILKVQRIPSLEEFCKGRGIEVKGEPKDEKEN